ncbi:MAG: hypothetical protein U9R03_00440 [Candidatus Aerophobetes bacterium]|nr:hypothetical protein [Candidatus Aerophobetes bacterium]
MRFKKDEVPTGVCNICKPPEPPEPPIPPPPPKPKRTYLPASLELYGCFLNFLNYKNYDFWKEFLKEIHDKLKIERITGMPYIVELGGMYNNRTPWKKEGGNWNLAEFKESWWKGLEEYLILMESCGILYTPIGFSRYQETPFKKNVNGVYGLWDTKARPYQAKYLLRLVKLLKKIYGSRPLWFRLSNEVQHRGDWDFGVTIAKQHEFWFKTIEPYIPMNRIIHDISHSDFTMLCEKHYYVEFPDGKKKFLTSKEYYQVADIVRLIDTLGNDEWDRKGWPEAHNVNHETLYESFEKGANKSLLWRITTCGWKKWVLSTDGGDRGSGEVYVGGTFKNMNKKELFAFCDVVYGQEKIKVMIADLPKEVFFLNKNGIIEEDFSLMNFDRLTSIYKAWEKNK